MFFIFLLFDILIRFRGERVVFIGDIEKVFLNVEVDKEDREFFRFLWLDDVDDFVSEIVLYWFCCVVWLVIW